jgi:predicted Zn-dependent protease
VANAALGLAAIAALTGQIDRARELLQLADRHGFPVASTYAAALLDRGSPDRTEALHTLGHNRPDDTDAFNFLGIAASADGDLEKARAFWDTSASRGDSVAPLLIQIAFPGED